jgi:hypothetical protein
VVLALLFAFVASKMTVDSLRSSLAVSSSDFMGVACLLKKIFAVLQKYYKALVPF